MPPLGGQPIPGTLFPLRIPPKPRRSRRLQRLRWRLVTNGFASLPDMSDRLRKIPRMDASSGSSMKTMKCRRQRAKRSSSGRAGSNRLRQSLEIPVPAAIRRHVSISSQRRCPLVVNRMSCWSNVRSREMLLLHPARATAVFGQGISRARAKARRIASSPEPSA